MPADGLSRETKRQRLADLAGRLIDLGCEIKEHKGSARLVNLPSGIQPEHGITQAPEDLHNLSTEEAEGSSGEWDSSHLSDNWLMATARNALEQSGRVRNFFSADDLQVTHLPTNEKSRWPRDAQNRANTLTNRMRELGCILDMKNRLTYVPDCTPPVARDDDCPGDMATGYQEHMGSPPSPSATPAKDVCLVGGAGEHARNRGNHDVYDVEAPARMEGEECTLMSGIMMCTSLFCGPPTPSDLKYWEESGEDMGKEEEAEEAPILRDDGSEEFDACSILEVEGEEMVLPDFVFQVHTFTLPPPVYDKV